MFWSKNKKNRYTPANPSFAIEKWGLRGYTFHGCVFLMAVCQDLTVRSKGSVVEVSEINGCDVRRRNISISIPLDLSIRTERTSTCIELLVENEKSSKTPKI